MRKGYFTAETNDVVPFAGRWMSTRSGRTRRFSEGDEFPLDEDGQPTTWRLSVSF